MAQRLRKLGIVIGCKLDGVVVCVERTLQIVGLAEAVETNPQGIREIA